MSAKPPTEQPISLLSSQVDDKKMIRRVYGGAALGALLLHVGIFLAISNEYVGVQGDGESNEARIEVTLDSAPSDSENNAEGIEDNLEELLPDLADTPTLDFTPSSEVEEILDFVPQLPDIPLMNPTDIIPPDSAITYAEQYNTTFDFTPPPIKKTSSPRSQNSGRRNAQATGTAEGGSMNAGGNAGGAITAPRYKSNPKPPYPSTARQAGNEGTVRVRISLDAEGHILDVRIHKSSGYSELDKAAQEFIKSRWQFYPAKKDGNSIPWTVIVPVIYSLNS